MTCLCYFSVDTTSKWFSPFSFSDSKTTSLSPLSLHSFSLFLCLLPPLSLSLSLFSRIHMSCNVENESSAISRAIIESFDFSSLQLFPLLSSLSLSLSPTLSSPFISLSLSLSLSNYLFKSSLMKVLPHDYYNSVQSNYLFDFVIHVSLFPFTFVDGYTTEDLVFEWKEGDPVQVVKELHLPRFTLQNFNTSYCTSKTNTG